MPGQPYRPPGRCRDYFARRSCRRSLISSRRSSARSRGLTPLPLRSARSFARGSAAFFLAFALPQALPLPLPFFLAAASALPFADGSCGTVGSWGIFGIGIPLIGLVLPLPFFLGLQLFFLPFFLAAASTPSRST